MRCGCQEEHHPSWYPSSSHWNRLAGFSVSSSVSTIFEKLTVVTILLDGIVFALSIYSKTSIGRGQKASSNLGVWSYDKALAVEAASIPAGSRVIAVLAELIISRQVIDSDLKLVNTSVLSTLGGYLRLSDLWRSPRWEWEAWQLREDFGHRPSLPRRCSHEFQPRWLESRREAPHYCCKRRLAFLDGYQSLLYFRLLKNLTYRSRFD